MHKILFSLHPILFRIGLVWLSSLPLFLSAFEFRILSWYGSLDGLFIMEGPERRPLQGSEQSLSPTYSADGESIIIYREARVEGDSVPVPVVTLPLPAFRSAILVISQDVQNPDRVSGVWLNDSKRTFPVGSFVFHNLSQHKVALQAVDEVHVLPSRENWSRRFGRDARSERVTAIVRDGDVQRTILNSNLKVHRDYRVIFVFRNGRASMANSGQIDSPVEFIMLYDYKEPEPEINEGEQRITGG
jgi:hypothetical protein